ncbi:MAG: SIS domain-containing protein [bacterium]|nr:SIS domain-containing protein [bacterium]
MRDSILKFAQQFSYEPKIENKKNLARKDKFIVIGMGGSHLAADLLSIFSKETSVIIHSNYGLPPIKNSELKKNLIVLSSYSGNTEEVIDAFHTAKKRGLDMLVVAIGGALMELAQKYTIPYIQLPDTHIQPRMALGFSIKALFKIIGDEKALRELSKLSNTLKPKNFEKKGQVLAKKLKGHIPVIYSSFQNQAIAHNWKIKLNETGKIPAFCNVFPELNHNEMTGFDVVRQTKKLSSKFYFIFLKDAADHPRIIKRMEITKKLYKARSLKVMSISISHKNIFFKIFSALLLADWAAYYTAKGYSTEPEFVPMVEDFKKMMR